MPRLRKRLNGTAGQDKKGPAGKRTKTKNPGEAPATVERPSPRETSALKKCGDNVSSYWLMKSEPESRLEKGVDVKFSIEDLKAEPKQTACWDGVRNYQARNFLRAMKLGQEAFFYHSNCKEPGIAGLVKVSCTGLGLPPSPFRSTHSGRQIQRVLASIDNGKKKSPPPIPGRTGIWETALALSCDQD
uniref:Thymocyte nuclear protein 1 n=1 Tax=Pipistrellus kuhlii TaxID=59472 RepID=A0A7J7UHQ5_PIPKU|nr:thymocyte nuclear protein 1 [Pipistrellus kuhlii]